MYKSYLLLFSLPFFIIGFMLASCNLRSDVKNNNPTIEEVRVEESVTPKPSLLEDTEEEVTERSSIPPSTITRPITPSTSSISSIATPSVTPVTVPSPEFSIDAMNTVVPEDILKEVSFYAGGGGGMHGNCSFFETNDVTAYPSQDSLIKMDEIDITVCGWQIGESVTVRVLLASEIVVEQSYDSNETGGIRFTYPITLESPEGFYTITFTGISGSVSTIVLVESPQSPVLYWFLDENKEDTGQLLLYNFKPHEHVRVLAYELITFENYGSFYDDIDANSYLVGWQEFQTNEEGTLWLQSNLQNSYSIVFYAAIGEMSGKVRHEIVWAGNGLMAHGVPEVLVQYDEVSEISESSEQIDCPGAFPTRLEIGTTARVIVPHLNVRENPAPNSQTVYGTSLSQGRTVQIIDGPICNGEMWWWKGDSGPITLTNGKVTNIVGWMAEQSGSSWMLEPVR